VFNEINGCFPPPALSGGNPSQPSPKIAGWEVLEQRAETRKDATSMRLSRLKPMVQVLYRGG
jgi:hypothetical protein